MPQGTYNVEVIRRLLVLKKLDGYPVIREVMEEEKEEEMTTLDMKEIQNMAEKLDEVNFLLKVLMSHAVPVSFLIRH